MIRVPETNLYYYSTTVEPDARLNYVFIKDYNEIPDPRNERACKSYVVGKDMEMTMGRGAPLDMSWFAMPDWQAPRYLDENAEFPKGKLETKQIKSKVAAGTEFEIKVYTPAGYDKDDAKRYPVAYVHGGSTAQMLGNIEDVLDGVAAAPNVQPSIIVLIGMQANIFQPDSPYPKIVAEDIVPFMILCVVTSPTLPRPKSPTFTSSMVIISGGLALAPWIRMLAGLMSRWMTLLECAVSRACRMPTEIFCAARMGRPFVFESINSRNEQPSTNSITR